MESLPAKLDPLIRPVMPELDSVRGIAVSGVLLLHAFYWQYSSFHFSGLPRLFLLATQPGGLGVNLFFVLSGFLITGILLDSKEKPRYFRRFYIRRALRILPAYYLLLISSSRASFSFRKLSRTELRLPCECHRTVRHPRRLWTALVACCRRALLHLLAGGHLQADAKALGDHHGRHMPAGTGSQGCLFPPGIHCRAWLVHMVRS